MSTTFDVRYERLARPADMESGWRSVATFAAAVPEPRNRPLELFCAVLSPVVWLVALTIPREGKHRRHAA